MIRKIKYGLGGRALRNEVEPVRLRGGANFRSAQKVGIIFKDVDRDFYDKVHEYAAHLKAKFDIKLVHCLAFVDVPPKKMPDYLRQKVDSEFFSRVDLNWHLKPVQNVSNFLSQDFDLLLDFSGGNTIPVNFIIKASMAKMKVGMRGTKAEPFCDFIIDMGEQFGIDKFIEQLDLYLSNPRIK